MAENFDSFSKDALQNIEGIRSSMLSIKDSAGAFSRALRDAGERTADYQVEFNNINISARRFAEFQEKAKNSSKGIGDALKQQQIQINVIKNLNNQIDILYLKASRSTGATKYNLEKQANALSAARDNAFALAKAYNSLAEDSAKLDKSTSFFSSMSTLVKDIPGLRTLSGPFEAAAKASREAVLSNAKLSGLTKEMLETGRGLTKEKIKELGLEEKVGRLTGSAAARKLRDAGITATPKSQLMAGLQGGMASAASSIKDIFSSGGWIGLLIKGIQMLVEAMFEADKQITDIAKNFIISKEQAAQVRDRFDEISSKAERFTLLQKGNQILRKEEIESNFKINELLGTKIDLTKDQGVEGIKLLNQFANISKFLKLSNEEQQGLLNLSATTGEEIDDIQLSILGTVKLRGYESKLLLNESKILKDILTLNNANKLTIKGGAEGLANAAFAAAKLGSNLKTVEGISKGLLQFEDSITSEIEAELLLGKEFNFEVARAAALFGDLETVAKEVNNQIGSAAEFSRMNVIQQSALAKAFGLQREELADILVQQESLNKLKDIYNIRAKDEIENLKINGKISDAVYNSIKQNKGTTSDYFKVLQQVIPNQEQLIKDLGEQAFLALRSQSAQDKFNEALEKAKEIFSSLVDGGTLDSLANAVTDFVVALSKGRGLFRQALFGSDVSATDRLAFEKSNLEKKLSSTTTTAEKDEIKNKIAEIDEKIKKINTIDLKMDNPSLQANSGLNVLKGPKFADGGIITRPIYNATIGEAGKEAILPLNEFYSRVDNTKMVALLEKLVHTVEKGGNVYIDGALLGNATVMANSKMGS